MWGTRLPLEPTKEFIHDGKRFRLFFFSRDAAERRAEVFKSVVSNRDWKPGEGGAGNRNRARQRVGACARLFFRAVLVSSSIFEFRPSRKDKLALKTRDYGEWMNDGCYCA